MRGIEGSPGNTQGQNWLQHLHWSQMGADAAPLWQELYEEAEPQQGWSPCVCTYRLPPCFCHFLFLLILLFPLFLLLSSS